MRAPVLTVSGYGVHSRQICEWLLSREDFDVTVQALKWGETSWMVNSDLESGLIGKIMEKSSPVEGVYDITFQVQLPDEWDPSLGHKIATQWSGASDTRRTRGPWTHMGPGPKGPWAQGTQRALGPKGPKGHKGHKAHKDTRGPWIP